MQKYSITSLYSLKSNPAVLEFDYISEKFCNFDVANVNELIYLKDNLPLQNMAISLTGPMINNFEFIHNISKFVDNVDATFFINFESIELAQFAINVFIRIKEF
ncbi:hypothetical protein [Chromobacterium vaccinii]|uniref:hypothetical protein n=1 Tax=Chromobacterium vaccinii TaxID=1108595 RepID=UPI0011C021ED|nr:hypothetical protein [Chromobacterium vaccinii]